MKSNVLVVGSIGLDDIKTTVEEQKNLLGGSASYAAVAASFFNPVNLVGVVGGDFPNEHRELYAARGINLEGLEVADGLTFRWSGEYELNMNNRQTTSLALNVFEKFEPKLPASYRASEYVLLANIAPSLQAMVLDQLDKPKFVVADTMDLWITIAKPDLVALLKRVDMLILNDGEARQLTEEGNLIKAASMIREMGPSYVAIKKGEHGCLLAGPEGLFVTGAFPLESVLDPTGAGDCFAGALIGYCAQQKDASFETLKHAVVRGTLVASFNVEQFSLQRLKSLKNAEIEERLGQFKKTVLF